MTKLRLRFSLATMLLLATTVRLVVLHDRVSLDHNRGMPVVNLRNKRPSNDP